jgi:predicted enzyme related to lactoylglutathione lyase
MSGQPVHIEIPADDTAKGREFWGSLFGWKFEAFPGPFEYHMARISDQAGAAITNMEPGKHGIRTYFDVDDINAGVEQVRKLGGESGEAAPVPNMGWFATCKDTAGNEFGLWQTDPVRPGPDRIDLVIGGPFEDWSPAVFDPTCGASHRWVHL